MKSKKLLQFTTCCAVAFSLFAAAANAQPCVIISEVVDGTFSSGQPTFIEITNTGNTPHTFGTGAGIIINSNGAIGDTTQDVDLDGVTIPAGASYVIAGNDATFQTVYGFAADMIDSSVNFNGDDALILTDEVGTFIDAYGVYEQDGTGQPWEYLDSYAYRNSNVNAPVSPFVIGEWTIAAVDSLEGADEAGHQAVTSPGTHTFDTPNTDCDPAEEIHLNEIYASHAGTDDQEMIELIGTPGMSLDGFAVAIVEGQALANGTLDAVWDLTGFVMPGDGYFVLGNTAVTNLDLDIGTDNAIENGTETFFLLAVSDMGALTAAVGTDVDANDDTLIFSAGGEFETVASIVDLIAMTDDVIDGVDDFVYDGAVTIGPDGTFFPAGIFRDEDYPGDWCKFYFLDFDDEVNASEPRTPGTMNSPCPEATGACCNRATLTCVDDVLESNCVGPDDEFTAFTACIDLDPPCAPIGACCFAGYCAGGFGQAACEAGGGIYQGDGTSCTTADCGTPTEGVVINEIRTDQSGADDDEFFELFGPPGTSLDGLWYIVIGDGTGGSGVIEAVVPLAGSVIPGDGIFLAAEASPMPNLGATPDLVTSMNFENSDNVTHLLVAGFLGADGDDLDANDDCTLETTPWLAELDRIALVEEDNPPVDTECHYGPPQIGPDGSFVPGHVERCPDGTGAWSIAAFGFGEDSPGDPNICAVCGNGVVEGTEECDDGNTDPGDGCRGDCTIEVCGDGILDPQEGCDDGNTDPGDGCDENCIVEECGNGVLQAGEECDDGNANNNDDCLDTCENAECGDGFVWNEGSGTEECDDGDTNDNNDCTNVCELAECGDGIVWNEGAGTEVCDDAGESATCDDDCTPPVCGDGNVNGAAGEDCDAFGAETPTCDIDCTIAECGDNLKNAAAGEQCDGTDDTFCPGLCQEDCQCPPPPPIIPTVTEWGLIVMTLLGLVAGTIVFARRRVVA